MDGQDFFKALQLHNDFFLNDKIHPVTAVKLDAFVLHGKLDLTSETNSAQVELVAQTLFVSRFQESRPQNAMDFNGGTND